MKRTLLFAAAAAFVLSACTTNPYTGEEEASNAGVGAAVGAAIGAIAGAVTTDSSKERRKRAAIGAGIGALLGTAVGAYMDAQEAKLREQLANTGVSVTRQGDNLVLNLPGKLTFDTDSAALRPDFQDVLRSVALVMDEYEQTLIDVEGHTDSTGSTAYNQTLSEQRAASVAEYLLAEGVNGVRVVAYGSGEDKPVASNASPDGRQLNRRVELTLEPLVI